MLSDGPFSGWSLVGSVSSMAVETSDVVLSPPELHRDLEEPGASMLIWKPVI